MAKSFLGETADDSELLDAVSFVRTLKTKFKFNKSLIFNQFPTSRLNLKINKSI